MTPLALAANSIDPLMRQIPPPPAGTVSRAEFELFEWMKSESHRSSWKVMTVGFALLMFLVAVR